LGLSTFEEVRSIVDVEDITSDFGTSPYTFWPPESVPSRLDSLSLCTDDTTDVLLAFYIQVASGPHCLVNTVKVPAGSGTDGVLPAIEAVPLLFPQTSGFVGTEHIGLSVVPLSLVTVDKHCWLVALGGQV